MKHRFRTALAVAAAVSVIAAGAASAAPATGWTANPGTTVADTGVVTLDSNNTAAGTSLENPNLNIPATNDTVITFQYSGECYAGGPRVFIQAGAFNTYNNGANCGGTAGSDGYRTVTATVTGVSGTTAGYTGIVNDSTGSVILVRNLTIGGVPVQLAAYANHGQCVSSSAAKNAAAKSDCGK